MNPQPVPASQQKNNTSQSARPIAPLLPCPSAPPLLILLIYTLLTLLLTHPLLFNLTTTVPNDIGDPLLNTWILAWDAHALLNDPLHLFEANIFHPLPRTLAYSEHLFSAALLALPLQLVSAEPIVAYNLSLLATFPLAAFGMYLLTLRWTGRRSAAFIAGLIFAFNPYRFAAIAHLQLLTFQWLPFALLCLDKILTNHQIKIPTSLPRPPAPLPRFLSVSKGRSPAPPLLLSLTIFLLLQILASWYLAIYTGFIAGLYLLVKLLIERPARAQLKFLIFPVLMSMLLTLPLAWPYISLLDELRQARPLSLALSLAAAPADFLAAAPFNRLFGPLTEPLRSRPAFTEENTLFLGILAPLLALISLVALWPRKKTGATRYASRITHHAPHTIALLAILSLALLLTLPAPYAALAALFPPSTIIRVPVRWIIPASFALAGLAAYGYTHLQTFMARFWQNSAKLLLLLVTGAVIAEAISIPLPLAPVENRQTLNPAYAWLANQPAPISLIELPLRSAPAPEFPEVKRLYASSRGWWRLVNGYSGYTPPRQPLLAQAITNFPAPEAITALQRLAATLPPDSLPFFLLIHPDEAPFDRARWENIDRWQAERQPALLPLGQFEGDYLYQIQPPGVPSFAQIPLATFGKEQTIRLLAVTKDIPDEPATTAYPPRLRLYWQATAPLTAGYTIFIHLRAPDGFVRSQTDGPPVAGHYVTTAWQPNEIIQDIHSLPPVDFNQIDHLAIGLYNPASGERLPAFDAGGQRLDDEALIVPLD